LATPHFIFIFDINKH